MTDGEESGRPPVLVLAVNGKVLGVDAATGARLWEHDTGGRGQVEIAVHRERVFANGIEPAVLCIEYPSGRFLGKADIPRREPGGRMLLEGDRLYIQGGGKVTCMSALDGRGLWHQELERLPGPFWEIAMGFPENVRQVDRTER